MRALSPVPEFQWEMSPSRSPCGCRSILRRWLRDERGRPMGLSPEMRERMRGSVTRAADAQQRSNLFSQFFVYHRDGVVAIQFHKIVYPAQALEFFLHHGLVTDKRLKQIV